MKRSTVVEVVAFALMLLYAYTASSKVLGSGTFVFLTKFLPLINKIPEVLLWILPLGEAMIIVMLAINKFKRVGFYSIVIFSGVSILYRSLVLLSGLHLPCLCGPYLRAMNEGRHLLFDSTVMALAIAGLILSRKKMKQDKTVSPMLTH